MSRHLLSTADLSAQSAIQILDVTEEMSRVSGQEVKKLPALRGRTVVTLFFEDSTRTRISFEAAAKRLSADVLNFAAKGSSVSKGESLKDTAQTLEAIGADAVVIRHPVSGAAHRLAHSGWIDAPVVNAGDGTHEHPTQALLDSFTMRLHRARQHGVDPLGSDLQGYRVVIVGDVLHSRVVRSNVWLLHTLGAHVTLVAPPTLLPVGVEDWPCTVRYDLDAVIAQEPDAVMMLRVQAERMKAAFFPSQREYSRLWGLDEGRLEALIGSAGHGREPIVMHPGPMNRGFEISARAADSAQSTVREQVKHGVSVRMAVLYLLLSGGLSSGEPDTEKSGTTNPSTERKAGDSADNGAKHSARHPEAGFHKVSEETR